MKRYAFGMMLGMALLSPIATVANERPDTVYVIHLYTEVYANASAFTDIVGFAAFGSALEVRGVHNLWYAVTAGDGVEGFVHQQAVYTRAQMEELLEQDPDEFAAEFASGADGFSPAVNEFSERSATSYATRGFSERQTASFATRGFSERSATSFATRGFSERSATSFATRGFSERSSTSFATRGFNESGEGASGAASASTADLLDMIDESLDLNHIRPDQELREFREEGYLGESKWRE